MNKLTNPKKFKDDAQDVNALMRKAKNMEKNGQFSEAAEIYRLILSKYPKNKRANLRLKKINDANPVPNLLPLIEAKRFDEVEKILLSNIERDNQNPNFWKLLGSIYYQTQNYSLSLQCNQKALELNPGDYALMHQIGCDLLEQDDVGNAFKAFKFALVTNPYFSKAHTKIGEIYNKIQDFVKAEHEWLKAIKVDPSDTLALTYLGINAIQNLGDCAKSQKYFETALDYEPHDVNNCVNLATIFYEQGQNEKSLEIFENWEKRNWADIEDQKKAEFRFNYSLALFADGQVSAGWQMFRGRLTVDRIMPIDTTKIKIRKLENIQDANHKRILLVMEQGVGDHLFQLGLLKQFIERTQSKIVLQVEPRLESLLSRSFPEVEVVLDFVLDDENIDYWMPYADLGVMLDFNPNIQAVCGPYLKRDPKLTSNWIKKLPNDKLNVGFSWRSGLIDARRLNSYTYLGDWTSIIENQDINAICLQYGDITEDLKELPQNLQKKLLIPDFNLKDDFESLALLIDECDLVFGPFTAPSIQAAAQGTETVIFNLKSGDRWSFGESLKYPEYQDRWYKNCHHIVFSQAEKMNLADRMENYINNVFQRKIRFANKL